MWLQCFSWWSNKIPLIQNCFLATLKFTIQLWQLSCFDLPLWLQFSTSSFPKRTEKRTEIPMALFSCCSAVPDTTAEEVEKKGEWKMQKWDQWNSVLTSGTLGEHLQYMLLRFTTFYELMRSNEQYGSESKGPNYPNCSYQAWIDLVDPVFGCNDFNITSIVNLCFNREISFSK